MRICLFIIATVLLVIFVFPLSNYIVTGSEEITSWTNKTQENYAFVTEWSSKGTGNGQFLRPHDLEFSNGDKYLYAVDRDGNRIQVFNKNGTFLFKFGEKGQGDGQFLIPYGLDVDARGHVWVADRGNHRIQQFDSKGKYDEPKIAWSKSTGLTSLIFLDSDKLGYQYRNDMFVGDVHNGRIYHFKLNNERDDLILPKVLAGKSTVNPTVSAAKEIVFGEGFGGITDLTVGPDGYLYVVSIGQGKVFRIVPN